MGEMVTIQVMRQLVKEWTLPDELKVSWRVNNSEEIADAEMKFRQYLADGWMAYSETPKGRQQIFKFDPQLDKIILIPPLGDG